jgi:hypothetical protein
MVKKQKLVQLSVALCPQCQNKGGLKKIIFGMPSVDFDHEKYISGGCIVSAFDPEIGCIRCGWEGLRREILKIHDVELQDGS